MNLGSLARRCPTCSRILFPTRECNYPFHYENIPARIWCPTSGKSIFAPLIKGKHV